MEEETLIPSTPPPPADVRKSSRARRPRMPIPEEPDIVVSKRRKSKASQSSSPPIKKKAKKQSSFVEVPLVVLATEADLPPADEMASDFVVPLSSDVLIKKKKKRFVPADVPPIACMQFYLRLQRKARQIKPKPAVVPDQDSADMPPVSLEPEFVILPEEDEDKGEEVSEVINNHQPMEKTPVERKSKKQQQMEAFRKSQPSVLNFFASAKDSPASPVMLGSDSNSDVPHSTPSSPKDEKAGDDRIRRRFNQTFTVEVPSLEGYTSVWRSSGKIFTKKKRVFVQRPLNKGDSARILPYSQLLLSKKSSASVYFGDNPGTRRRLENPRPIYIAIHDRERPPVKFILTHESVIVHRRKPLASDPLIDYDKDSDEEYEEEKEGEDLNSNNAEEDDAEEGGAQEPGEEAESEADSFFVSDGHFSEDDALSDDEAVVVRRRRQEIAIDSEGKSTLQLICFSPSDLENINTTCCSSMGPAHAKWLSTLSSEAVIQIFDLANYFNANPQPGDESTKKKKDPKPPKPEKPVIDWASVRPELAKFIHGKTTNIDSLCSEFKLVQPELSANAIKTEIRTIAAWTKKPEINSRVAWYVKQELFEQLGLTELEMTALLPTPPPPLQPPATKEKLFKDQVLNFEAVVADREVIHN